MKPFVKVTFDFGDEIKEVKFTNKENIEELIDVLTAAHEELEHRIQMRKIRRKEAKQRKREQNHTTIPVEDFLEGIKSISKELEAFSKKDVETQYKELIKEYNEAPESVKAIMKPLMEIAKDIHDKTKV